MGAWRQLSLVLLAVLTFAAPAAGPGAKRVPAPPAVATEARTLLETQAAAWNRGDLEAFCAVYADDALFLTAFGLTKGRAEVLARYKARYPDAAARGTLSFEVLTVDVLDPAPSKKALRRDRPHRALEDLPRRQASGGGAHPPEPGQVPGRLANRPRRVDVTHVTPPGAPWARPAGGRIRVSCAARRRTGPA